MNDETVVENQETEAQPTETEAVAQEEPSLDDVLSEIDKEFEQATKEPEQSNEDKDKIAQLEERLAFIEGRSVNDDINQAVSDISKSLDVQVPTSAIRGMLNDMAVKDQRLAKAFDNRHNDPKGWARAVKAASKDIGKEFAGMPDKNLTDDREAVSAAVRGASKTTVADEAPDFTKMTDAQYEEWKYSQR